MPIVTIPDATFERLARQAAVLNVTVEQMIAPLLERFAEGDNHGRTSLSSAPFDDWEKHFQGWMADVQSRVNRYPPGFVMDDSRASIYEGCGE